MLNLTTSPSANGLFEFVNLDNVRTDWRLHTYTASSGRTLCYATKYGRAYAQQLDRVRVLNFIEKQLCRERKCVR